MHSSSRGCFVAAKVLQCWVRRRSRQASTLFANVVTIVSTVVTIVATGFAAGRLMDMYPIKTAIINACHSGRGGAGDAAILTAADRMQPMPFAQITTWIEAAVTVTLILILLGYFK